MLKGKKVILRPLKKSDIPLFLKWFNDPEITQYLLWYLPMTELAEEKWYEEAATGRNGTQVFFVIEATENNKPYPIGSISLDHIDPKNQRAEFGIAIGEKKYWDKGYGTEAARLLIDYGFKQLNLNRISSSAFAPNKRSLKIHQKVGFVKEGVRKQALFKHGKFLDQVIFGLLRENWKG